MSEKAIGKLWAFFGGSWLSLSILFFLRTTGMNPKGDSFGILGYTAATVPALALPVDFVLMSLFLCISLVWSRAVGGPSWAHRQPVFYFDRTDVNPASDGGRIYQGAAFFGSMVAPLIATALVAARFFGGSVFANCSCQLGKIKVICAAACAMPDPPRIAKGQELFDFAALTRVEPMLRFGDVEGPQFFPVLPWLYAAWGIALLAVWFFAVWSIFLGAASRRKTDNGDRRV